MSDDICRPHAHFQGAPSLTCHHFFPRNGEWHCMCGAVRQSVVNRDVGKKHKDRVER